MIKKLAPVVILAALLIAAYFIRSNPPETQRRGPSGAPQMMVETISVDPQTYMVRLQSYGTVQPRTRSALVAQVAGQVVSVSPAFRDGGFFERGDMLAQIDAREYEANVQIARASVFEAEQALAEAQARTEQARIDWQRLGNEGQPSELVQRLPQLRATEARLLSSESNLGKAQLDLERTTIVAPFAGRVLDAQVDIGQVVAPNGMLADIYATDYVEVRLPLRNADLPFITLPESFRNGEDDKANEVTVELRSELGATTVWPARLVRTESAIDPTARQLHVIAQIDDPFSAANATRAPLKIGQYVTAELDGMVLDNAIVIPNRTIYQGSFVYTVEDGLLQRKEIDIAWQNDTEAVISQGLVAGAQLVTTTLGQVTSGLRVGITGAERPPRSPRVGGARSNP